MTEKKPNFDFGKYLYTVSGRSGFKLSQAVRLWKAKYPEFEDFAKDVITHPSYNDFGLFMAECWDGINPITVEDALSQENTELRRVYFDCIGIQKLFESLNPILRDRQVIKKKRYRWDDKNTQERYEFEDVYELYEIAGEKLFNKDRWGRKPNPVYAVRCWCTTTNREYWLYVDSQAATGKSQWFTDEKSFVYDAIRAIAWTIRIDVTEPERIYRQGDIIVAKLSADSKIEEPYHLNKEQYLSLMYSET